MPLSEGSHQPCTMHLERMGSGCISKEAHGALWSLYLAHVHTEHVVRRSPGTVKRGKHFENGRMEGVGHNRLIRGKLGVSGARI